MEELQKKLANCIYDTSIDMDASSNDACQWAELKTAIDTYLVRLIEPQIRASFTWIPTAVMTAMLKIMRTQKSSCSMRHEGKVLFNV